MKPTLCLIAGCNGADETTLARELLPRMGIRRFLNTPREMSEMSKIVLEAGRAATAKMRTSTSAGVSASRRR